MWEIVSLPEHGPFVSPPPTRSCAWRGGGRGGGISTRPSHALRVGGFAPHPQPLPPASLRYAGGGESRGLRKPPPIHRRRDPPPTRRTRSHGRLTPPSS